MSFKATSTFTQTLNADDKYKSRIPRKLNFFFNLVEHYSSNFLLQRSRPELNKTCVVLK